MKSKGGKHLKRKEPKVEKKKREQEKAPDVLIKLDNTEFAVHQVTEKTEDMEGPELNLSEQRDSNEGTVELMPEKKEKKKKVVKEKASKEKRERKPAKLRGLFIMLAVIVAILALGVLGVSSLFNHYYAKLNVTPREDTVEQTVVRTEPKTEEIKKDLNEDLAYDSKKVTNILVVGVDNDYAPGMNERGNADGLILASINHETKQIVLTSFMRDINVAAGDIGRSKLTLVYHYSGLDALIDSIESNFEIPIDNYVLLNYLDVIDIVDAAGGLTLDVNQNELYWMEEKIKGLCVLEGVDIEPNLIPYENAGTLHLNGIQTAAYMRIRMAGNNDFERTERIRRVIIGLKDKALSMNISGMNRLVETAVSCVSTDMTRKEMLPLILNAVEYLGYEMVSNRIPIEGSYEFENHAGSMLMIDFDVNNKYLREIIYGSTK